MSSIRAENNSEVTTAELVETLPKPTASSDWIDAALQAVSTLSIAAVLVSLFLQQRGGQGALAWTMFIGGAVVCAVNVGLCWWLNCRKRAR